MICISFSFMPFRLPLGTSVKNRLGVRGARLFFLRRYTLHYNEFRAQKIPFPAQGVLFPIMKKFQRLPLYLRVNFQWKIQQSSTRSRRRRPSPEPLRIEFDIVSAFRASTSAEIAGEDRRNVEVSVLTDFAEQTVLMPANCSSDEWKASVCK